MKCFFAVVLLALFAVAFAIETPEEPKNIQQVNPADPDAPRDKRGVLLSYTAPLAYTSYAAAPLAYSGYNVPYAYRTYPYFYNSHYYG